jgi:hypothetical protein
MSVTDIKRMRRNMIPVNERGVKERGESRVVKVGRRIDKMENEPMAID